MPTLIKSGFNAQTNKPMMWMCSGCEASFTHGSMREASIPELHKINDEFRVHCQQKHPGESVIGIMVPKAKEDASQAAARIVREATENR